MEIDDIDICMSTFMYICMCICTYICMCIYNHLYELVANPADAVLRTKERKGGGGVNIV